MWTIVSIVGVILLLVLVLSVPVTVAFSIEKDSELRKNVRLRWLFGLVRKDLGRPGRPAQAKTGGPVQDSQEK